MSTVSRQALVLVATQSPRERRVIRSLVRELGHECRVISEPGEINVALRALPKTRVVLVADSGLLYAHDDGWRELVEDTPAAVVVLALLPGERKGWKASTDVKDGLAADPSNPDAIRAALDAAIVRAAMNGWTEQERN